MILCTTGPVFQSQPVFNGKNDLPIRFQMSGNNLQKIHIRIFTLNICLPVLKHTDQSNIIVFFCQILFNLLEISHKDFQIILIFVSVRIDPASFHRQINTGDFFCFSAEYSGNSTASCTYLQNLFFACKRKPA